jgi:L-alanine-DL-glutamate epimerase-like enolase superfamily enzyme
MKITKVEIVQSKKQIQLPIEWRVAWGEPDVKPRRSFGFSFFKVHTDEGICGIGPRLGVPDDFVMSFLDGFNPFYVEKFWNVCMRGRAHNFDRGSYGGLEVALWDIIGKTLGEPIYKILGPCRDKIMAYAATTRLLKPKEHEKQTLQLMDLGFKAVKLRLHRPDPREDVEMVKAVRDAVGDDLMLLVDANQNNRSINYRYWSRRTAQRVANELENLDVFFLEEPLPRNDIEGLAELADLFNMYIAGGEHSSSIYDFKNHIIEDAYDILQPDLILGDIGIHGLRKISVIADYFNKMVVPHVCSAGSMALSLAAVLQAMATVENCPMIEYPFDPPILTIETQMKFIKEPLMIDKNGLIKIPDKPGIGIELDEMELAKYI